MSKIADNCLVIPDRSLLDPVPPIWLALMLHLAAPQGKRLLISGLHRFLEARRWGHDHELPSVSRTLTTETPQRLAGKTLAIMRLPGEKTSSSALMVEREGCQLGSCSFPLYGSSWHTTETSCHLWIYSCRCQVSCEVASLQSPPSPVCESPLSSSFCLLILSPQSSNLQVSDSLISPFVASQVPSFLSLAAGSLVNCQICSSLSSF